MGLSEIDGDFSRKWQNFPTPCILCPVVEFPLELGTSAGVKKTRMMELPGRQMSLTVSSAVLIRYGIDRRTDTGRQQRPRLRIASRSKNLSNSKNYHRVMRYVALVFPRFWPQHHISWPAVERKEKLQSYGRHCRGVYQQLRFSRSRYL